MAISYNGLWKLLIDKGMKKGDLCKSTGLSSSTMAKMTNGEPVNLSVLERICESLDCDFADLVNYKKTQEKNEENWLQIGYKNFENTEKINIFRKYDNRKPRKHAICHKGFSKPNP